MKRLMSILLACLLSVAASWAATENFDTWTETDTGGYLAPSGTTLTATAVPRNQICYVSKDFGADYWNGDFTVKFQFVPGAVSHTNTTSFLGLCAFTDALYNWYHLSVNGGAGVTPVYSRDTTGYKLFLWMVKSGSEWYAFSDNIYVSLGTTYYVTFSRDYDGGTYEKGLYTLTVCTGNYYGESGASLVGQKTLDAPTAAVQNFQYVLTGLSKLNGGVQTASGTISNLDLSGAPSEDPPSKVTGAYPPTTRTIVSLSATVSGRRRRGPRTTTCISASAAPTSTTATSAIRRERATTQTWPMPQSTTGGSTPTTPTGPRRATAGTSPRSRRPTRRPAWRTLPQVGSRSTPAATSPSPTPTRSP